MALTERQDEYAAELSADRLRRRCDPAGFSFQSTEELQEHQERQQALFEELKNEAESRGFRLLQAPQGLVLAPVQDGKPVTPDEFEKLATRFANLVDLVREASKNGNGLVAAGDVEQAIKEGVYRLNQAEERMQHLVEEGSIMIDTEGDALGQISPVRRRTPGPSHLVSTIFMNSFSSTTAAPCFSAAFRLADPGSDPTTR